ncbi:MAG: response regulator [Kiritimatiellaeota bacterium]|nr:response regulator [Kiritimatiellota bacterium]
MKSDDLVPHAAEKRSSGDASARNPRELDAKRAVIAHIRHELRTPINGIIGYSEMLLEDAAAEGWDTITEDLTRVLSAGQELLSLVNELLGARELAEQTDLDVAELGRSIRHALITPISAVTGYSELLMEDAEDTAFAGIIPDLRRIHSAGKKLAALIDDIVSFSMTAEIAPDSGVSAGVSVVLDTVSMIRALAENRTGADRVECGSLLIVDDNETNRDLLARRLERCGHQVAAASNGRRALEMLREQPFDLLLLDVMMPEMNGFEVLQHLKHDPELRHIPVIMISALDEMDSVVRCIEAGAEDYLPKPFNPVLLHARIGAGLAKKRLHDIEREYAKRLQTQWESAKRLEDNLRKVVRYSLQKPPEEMLAESLRILIALSEAQMGAILEEDGPNLRFLCASVPDLIGAVVPWESVAGETFTRNVITYAPARDELRHYGPAGESHTNQVKCLLSVPIPRVISARRTQASAGSAGVLQLLFARNALAQFDLAQGPLRLGMDLSGRHDSEDRLLQELFMVLPMISLGMEIQKLRQTSYQAIHELKNKLIAAQSWTNCLKEDLEAVAAEALGDEDVMEDIKLVEEAVTSGYNLAVGYLQFTKIYNPHFEVCRINTVLKEVATDIKAFADNVGGPGSVSVVVDPGQALPKRQLDPAQLKMAFFNIGKNAVEALIEHGTESPTITLLSQLRDDRIVVTIADNGKGMPKAVAENLFVPFTTQKTGGTGLGLTITKKIVDMHGGKISCESDSTGTRFQILL